MTGWLFLARSATVTQSGASPETTMEGSKEEKREKEEGESS